MSNQKNAVDRVRPFLQAMEQSITAARQRRLQGHREPGPIASSTTSINDVDVSPDADGTPRLRARPKRPSKLIPSYQDSSFRSQAG